jgi:hypothetical protein
LQQARGAEAFWRIRFQKRAAFGTFAKNLGGLGGRPLCCGTGGYNPVCSFSTGAHQQENHNPNHNNDDGQHQRDQDHNDLAPAEIEQRQHGFECNLHSNPLQKKNGGKVTNFLFGRKMLQKRQKLPKSRLNELNELNGNWIAKSISEA